MTSDRQVTVISRKYDLSIRRSWNCGLITQKADLLVMVGIFGETIEHADLGQIQKGTVSFEYYWLDRWYNIFRFSQPDGQHRNYYCNIIMPPKFDGRMLDYVDLDIDLIVWPDGEVVMLDEDDFVENAKTYAYPDEVIGQSFAAVDELKRMIGSREFPFEAFS